MHCPSTYICETPRLSLIACHLQCSPSRDLMRNRLRQMDRPTKIIFTDAQIILEVDGGLPRFDGMGVLLRHGSWQQSRGRGFIANAMDCCSSIFVGLFCPITR
eukprot:GHVO01045822.1.p1 GENE.GHVO01045822.1~~GHVO01045822.1.p1  ORF type:complete len:103 (-),score=4.76 GHVO01045822.1:533-841(-)